MKVSQRKARRKSIWSNRPEHQDLQESRSGRLWAGRQASCQSKKAWKNYALNNALSV
ncbi:hypothetical protein [Kluyvera sp. 142486]|uniref:hypothetical protein n=1 Tax=Kluyvera sp. 142486 TaxID=3390050 RepID=UPI0039813B9B